VIRRISAFAGGLGVVVSLLAGTAVPARAVLVSDTIGIVGTATISQDSDADVPAAVDLEGGIGSFNFTALACAGSSDGDVGTPLEAGTCTATGGGGFTNTVCGTGTVTGGVTTITLKLIPSGTEVIQEMFAISFTALIGVLTVPTALTQGPDDGGTLDNEPGVGGAAGGNRSGVVLIAPGNPGVNDAGDCTSAFTFVIGGTLGEGPGS